MTVMAIAGMMLLLIGLMAMLTLERKTARSYSDATRAEMAIESGLADAIATISPIASRDDTLVFRLDDPTTPLIAATATQPSREQFFTFGAQYDTGKKSWRVLPFVSGLKELTAGTTTVDATALNNQLKTFSTQTLISLGQYDRQVPRGAWVNVSPVDSPYTMRYAWWVEDLSGRIDGANAGAEPRTLGATPQEINYFTLFNPTADKDAVGPEDKLIEQRDKLRSAASARMILGETDARKIEPYLTYQLPKTVNQVPLIPHGFGYADAGQPAKNLTDLINQKNVTEIAAHIDRNLPNFQTRKGGFPSTENYTRTIAASIIDYADTDSDATTGIGFRGVDSYPFVNELYDRYMWIGPINNKVQIEVTTYVELWNPANVDISGTMEFTNINTVTATVPLVPELQAFTTVKFSPIQLKMKANEFKVIEAGKKTYEFNIGIFPPSSINTPTSNNSSFELRWNGSLVDFPRGKVTRQTNSLNSTRPSWKGNASCPSNISLSQFADPRSNVYTTQFWFNNTYADNGSTKGNSSMGGRNYLTDEIPKPFSQQLVSSWPDRGAVTNPGIRATSVQTTPLNLMPQFPATETVKAPAFIANKPMLSLVEIGNVFDPAQWSAVQTIGTPSSIAGGGFTLAIGRPEYAVFDREGQRAAQLLDLFTLQSTNTITPSSRVNLNTAPREVLRTLISGQALNNDPNQAILYPPKDSTVGDRFADAVIASRNRAPLRSISDLNLIRKNPSVARNYSSPTADTEPFFGSTLQYPVANRPGDAWDDAGREELFQRVTNLVTFQSKTFRIVVAGQVLDKNGTVIGRRAREFTLEISPARDATGAIIANQPLVIRTLTERSL